MILYPAIDLMGGRIVRLTQGRFDSATRYDADPAEALRGFAEAGASWAHIVDLDGARAGSARQHRLLQKLARSSPVKLQVAGGFRTRDQIARMIDAGVGRVAVGSLSVKDPARVRGFLDEFGADRITIALDVRIASDVPLIAISGWKQNSGRSLWDIAALYPEARHMLITDIGRDGMLEGPNFRLLDNAVACLPGIAIQASGGVSSLNDLRRLSTAAAVVGKALWEGRFELGEAIRACA